MPPFPIRNERECRERKHQNLDPHLQQVGIADERHQNETCDGGRSRCFAGSTERRDVQEPLRQNHAPTMPTFRPSKQAVGLDDQHDRHEQKHKHQRHFGEDQNAESLELADDERCQKCAGHRSHASDHGDDERLRNDRNVHAEVGCAAR